jgi:type II secretory pathway pseudopilin PulG
MIEIMVVVALIAVLAALAMPSYIKSRHTARQNACINNLWQIDSAKEQAALSLRWLHGSQPTTVIVNTYIKGDTTPECPGGGVYTYSVIGSNPMCNIVSPVMHLIQLK